MDTCKGSASSDELQTSPSWAYSDPGVSSTSMHSLGRGTDKYGITRKTRLSDRRLASSPEDTPSCLSSSPPETCYEKSIGSSCHTFISTDLTVGSLQSAPTTLSRFKLALKGRQCFGTTESSPTQAHPPKSKAPLGTNTNIPNYTSSNDRRMARRSQHLIAMTEDLIEGVVELFMQEQRTLPTLSFDLVEQWNSSLSGTTSNNNDQRREVTCEEARDAIRNFFMTLPVRYPVGIHSPAEVLLHMRFLAGIRSQPLNAAVHINTLDEELDVETRLAFSPALNGMCNLKVITVACQHSIGLMEMVMGSLVTGGSEILETDYLLSSEKMMLVSQRLFFQVLKRMSMFPFVRFN